MMKCVPTILILGFLLTACGGGGGGSSSGGGELMPGGGSEQVPGGGGGGGGDSQQMPGAGGSTNQAGAGGSSGSGGANPVPTRQPSLTANGVRAVISFVGGSPLIDIREPGSAWATPPNDALGPPADWTATTELDGVSTLPTTGRFHVVTDYGKDNDDDYLAYGFWSKNTPDSQGADGFASFFYGNMPWAGNVATLPVAPQPQPVTYRGGAAGVYKILGTAEVPVQGEATYGHFKANIRLVASFGQNGKVLGYLTDITPLRPLNSKNPALSGVHHMSAEFSGSAFAGRGPRCGGTCWGGQFFGPSGSEPVPTGAAGWFERLTSYESGDDRAVRLDGSFGAVKQ